MVSTQSLPRIRRLTYGAGIAQQYPHYLNNQPHGTSNLDLYGSNLKVTRGTLSHTNSPSFNAYNRPDLKPTRGFGGSQNFNVGYSLSLTNGKLPRTHHVSHDLDYSDIITGKPKDSVSKPTNHRNFNKPPLYAFSGPKKLKHVSMYKKNPFSLLGDYNEHSLSQSNIFPNKNLFPTLETKSNNDPASWRSVSPAVEIYESKEIPFNNKYSSVQSQNFDHQKALGRSQGFDYSNVIEGQHSDQINNEATNVYRPKIPQTSDLLTFPSELTTKGLGAPPSIKTGIRQNIDFSNFNSHPISLPKLQYDTKAFPQLGALSKGASKVPIDTSLLGAINQQNPITPPITIDTSRLNLDTNSQNPSFNSQNIDFTKYFKNQEPKNDGKWTNFHQEKMLHFDNQENKNAAQHELNLYQHAMGSRAESQTSPHGSLFQSYGTNGDFSGKYNFDNGVDLKPPPFLPRKIRYPQ